jgi:hypothetical protein
VSVRYEAQLPEARKWQHPTPMYRCELCIDGGTVSSAAPAPAGKGAVRGLYMVTAPAGTASGRRAVDSGASWCLDAVTAGRNLTRARSVGRIAVKSLRRFHSAPVKRQWQSRTQKTMSSSRSTNLVKGCAMPAPTRRRASM